LDKHNTTAREKTHALIVVRGDQNRVSFVRLLLNPVTISQPEAVEGL
jgi:hypothetical protein